HVFARPIDAVMAVLDRLPHGDLGDAKAQTVGNDGQEAMLIAVQIEFIEDASAQGAGTASQVVELQAGERSHEAMEERTSHAIEHAGRTRRTHRHRYIRAIEPGDELTDVRCLDLLIRG